MTDRAINPPEPRSAPAETRRPVAANPVFPAWLPAVLLALVTLALYWPATNFDFINFDDHGYVANNPRVKGGLTLDNIGWAFTTGEMCNWLPLTRLSFMLDVELFGLSPGGFHFTNLVLHTINVVLLFWLLRRLTNAAGPSALAAALFGWHPVHVESVAWISERKDVLSAGFGFLALIFYVRYGRGAEVRSQNTEARIGEPGASAPASHSSCSYWMALLCFAAGLMSKPMLVTWPFVLLLLDYWPLNRWQPRRRRALVREKIPFFLLAGAACLVTFLVQERGGAVAGLPPWLRAENALISYCRYLGKLFWPTNLAIFYPRPGHWPVAGVILALIFLGGVSALFWRQRRRYPFLLVGWLWYCGTLVPVIGLVQVGDQAMADRYTYLPSVGILILTIWGVRALCRPRHFPLMGFWIAGLAAMVCCLVLTRRQLGYWRNSETLFRHTLAVTKDNDRIHNDLGVVLAARGQFDSAISQYEEALSLNPGDARFHNNFGTALGRKGETDLAISQFQAALRLDANYAEAHNNLGITFANLGRMDEAVGQFREALRVDPNYTEAQLNLEKAMAVENNSAVRAPGPVNP